MQNEMSNTTDIDMNDPAVVEKVFGDESMRSLPIGSDEFKAALANAGKTEGEEPDTDATAGEGEETETEDTETTEDEEADNSSTQKKPKKGMLRRIEKLVEEKHELQRRLEAMEVASKQAVERIAEQTTGHSEYNVPKPKIAEFNNLEEYTDALTEWKLNKREYDREMQAQVESFKTTVTKVAENWQEKEAAVKKEYADYDEVVNLRNIEAADTSQEAKIFLSDSEFGPQVVYTLLSDDELVEQFSKANPIQQVKILTKLEGRFEGKQEKKSAAITTASKAPAPPKSLPKSKSVLTGKDLIAHAADLSDAEWLRMADEYARNKRRR